MTSKLPNTTTSIFSIMSKLASDHNAINLAQGFPGFDSDPALIDLVNKAMKNGYNQYAPMPGDKKLRQVISEKIESLYYKKYNADREITITAGATQAIFTAIAATIHKDDEVIVFTPAYDCYKPSIELFGGKVVELQLEAPTYKPNWKQVVEHVTTKTKMILVNTPHNPTGTLLSEDDMLQLQKISEENDLLVLSDEVYEHIIFDGKDHQSAAKFPQLAKRTFITASFGKTFHNTGWKMGYCIAPEYLMKEFQKVHQYNVFSVNHPIQKALATYLQDSETYLSLPQFYQKKRDYFLDLIKDSRFKFTPSKGTYFQLLDFSEISEERDVDFADRLTREHKIATIPTSVFNQNQEDYKQIRVCFAKTEKELKEAAEILNSI